MPLSPLQYTIWRTFGVTSFSCTALDARRLLQPAVPEPAKNEVTISPKIVTPTRKTQERRENKLAPLRVGINIGPYQ